MASGKSGMKEETVVGGGVRHECGCGRSCEKSRPKITHLLSIVYAWISSINWLTIQSFSRIILRVPTAVYTYNHIVEFDFKTSPWLPNKPQGFIALEHTSLWLENDRTRRGGSSTNRDNLDWLQQMWALTSVNKENEWAQQKSGTPLLYWKSYETTNTPHRREADSKTATNSKTLHSQKYWRGPV